MNLEPGTKLSHYEIVEPVGKGGMGEVYRARDTRLGRDVAIKVLPEELARDTERLDRFEREARLLAQLNHANVATLHGLEEHDAQQFLVMELVEGETLAERIAKGPIPVDEAVPLFAQIAEGLEAAHEKGIIHRDLKPANIKFTLDNKIKILDFGLAKAFPPKESGSTVASQSPTLTQGTALGVILGTAPYMSPEQARGSLVDKRTDIWAFGCCLYEALTGRATFLRDTISDTVAAILQNEPDWRALPSSIPGSLEKLLRRCLQKNSTKRLRDIGDVRLELEEFSTDLVAELDVTRETRFARLNVVAVVVAAAAVVFAVWTQVTTGRTTHSFAITLSKQLTSENALSRTPSLSNDGRSFVYASNIAGDWNIYLRRVNGARSINLTPNSSVDDSDPAYSPDDELIAFRSDRNGGGIFVMGATGESVRRVSEFGYHPAWSHDGERLFYVSSPAVHGDSPNDTNEIWSVEVSGGTPLRVLAHGLQPRASPNGHRIAYMTSVNGQRDIWTSSTEGGDAVPVKQHLALDRNPVWSPDGRFLYFLSDRVGTVNLWRTRLDERSGEVHGVPEPVTAPSPALADFSLSGDGARIVYTTRVLRDVIQKVGFDMSSGVSRGTPLTIARGAPLARRLDVSRDGEWLAYENEGPQLDLFVTRADGTETVRLTNDAHRDFWPRWSPDGERLAFYSNRGGDWEIWSVRRDGSDLKALTETEFIPMRPAWSPEGSRMAFCTAGAWHSYIFDTAQPWAAQQAVEIPLDENGLFLCTHAWSPDGRWLAGSLWRENLFEGGIGLHSLETGENRTLTEAGDFPAWLPDSSRIVLASAEARIQTRCGASITMVDIETQELTEVHSPSSGEVCDPVVSHDGRLLYYILRTEESDLWLLELTD